jgi:hypothetical protein
LIPLTFNAFERVRVLPEVPKSRVDEPKLKLDAKDGELILTATELIEASVVDVGVPKDQFVEVDQSELLAPIQLSMIEVGINIFIGMVNFVNNNLFRAKMHFNC